MFGLTEDRTAPPQAATAGSPTRREAVGPAADSRAGGSRLVRSWPALALLVLFAVSVLLRLPSFSIDPVEDAGWTPYERYSNTEVWTHNWHVLDVYATEPAGEHLFASYIEGSWPCTASASCAEEFIANSKNPDLTVYTSFPPTAFIALYAVMKVFGGGNYTYEASQIFGLALHALCVGLIAYLAYLLTRNKLISVLAGAIYTFSTATMWYHMNVYWAHELLMPVFIAALVVFVRRKGAMRWWQSLFFGFAMTLITWTGAVAAVGFAAYGLWRYLRTRERAHLAHLFMVAGMAAAVAVVLLQVLVVTGSSPVEYVERVVHRAGFRSSGSDSMPFGVMAWRFVNSLMLDYGGFLVIAFALAVRKKLTSFQWAVVFVSTFPLLETFVVLEHDTTYGFGRLKWLVPVIVLICMGAANLSPRRRGQLALAVAAASVLHVALYFLVFTPVA